MLSRLCSNIVVKEKQPQTTYAYVDEVYGAYKRHCGEDVLTEHRFSKAIRQIWPDIKAGTRKRTLPTNVCKTARYYRDMYFHKDADNVVSKSDIIQLLPANGITAEDGPEKITYIMDTGNYRNGQRIMKDTTLSTNGQCTLKISAKAIFSFEGQNFGSTVAYIRNLQLCKGLNSENIHHSTNCSVVILDDSVTPVCSSCRNRHRYEKQKRRSGSPHKGKKKACLENRENSPVPKASTSGTNPTDVPCTEPSTEPGIPQLHQITDNSLKEAILLDEFDDICKKLGLSEDKVMFMKEQARNNAVQDARQRRWDPK